MVFLFVLVSFSFSSPQISLSLSVSLPSILSSSSSSFSSSFSSQITISPPLISFLLLSLPRSLFLHLLFLFFFFLSSFFFLLLLSFLLFSLDRTPWFLSFVLPNCWWDVGPQLVMEQCGISSVCRRWVSFLVVQCVVQVSRQI